MSRRQRNQITLELWCLDGSISLENPKDVFSIAKNIEFIEEKRRNRRMQPFIAINGPDHALIDELTWLSHERSIDDEASTVSHVAHF